MTTRVSLTASPDDLTVAELCAQISDMSFAEASIALHDLNVRIMQKGGRALPFVLPVAYGPTLIEDNQAQDPAAMEEATALALWDSSGVWRWAHGRNGTMFVCPLNLDAGIQSTSVVTAAGASFAATALIAAGVGGTRVLQGLTWVVAAGAAAQGILTLQVLVSAVLKFTLYAACPANDVRVIPIPEWMTLGGVGPVTITNAGAVAANTVQSVTAGANDF